MIVMENIPQLCQKLQDIIEERKSDKQGDKHAAVINVAGILPKATLEALGDGNLTLFIA